MSNRELIRIEFNEVKKKHNSLDLYEKPDESFQIIGDLHFIGTYNSIDIEDCYTIQINIPTTYPEELPTVKELGGRIPQYFHTNFDNTLCLGTPLSKKLEFSRLPTLLGFIDNCLISYLFAYSYKQINGTMPYGEYSHETRGIIEHYEELFLTKDIQCILKLLLILAGDSYRGHLQCPCGSNKRLRNCHGNLLLQLKELQSKELYWIDVLLIKEYWNNL